MVVRKFANFFEGDSVVPIPVAKFGNASREAKRKGAEIADASLNSKQVRADDDKCVAVMVFVEN